MLSPNEKTKVLKFLLLNDAYWPKDCEEPLDPEGKVINVENFRLLLDNLEQINKEDLDENGYLNGVYKIIINLRSSGAFIRKVAQVSKPVDPATTLPHSEIKELKSIRNVADVKRIANLPKEKLKELANLKPGSPSFKELNERLQYIREHKIGEGEPPTVVDKTEEAESKNPDEPYTKARAIVKAVTNKDVGSVGSGPGQSGWEKANRFKERVSKIVDQEEKKGTDGPAVLKWVKQELADLQSSSAR